MEQLAKVCYKYTFSLANGIKDQGVDIDLVIDLKEEEDGCRCKRIRMFNTDEKNIGKIKKLINYVSSSFRVLHLAKRENYDIIHTQWVIFAPVDYWFMKILKRRGMKLVITIHDILPFNQKFYDYFYHKKIYALADHLILQTQDNVQRFDELFPEVDTSKSVIPHGHFLDYANPIDKDIARETLGLESDKFIFLFFGQIKKVKGVDVLLEAYANMLDQHPHIKGKVKLIIAGSIWKTDYGKCEEIIARTGIASDIRTDIRYIPDDEVGVYYSASDVCVLPYLDVYQSGVLQLTYAYQKAAIVTDLPAFIDVIDESRGIICKRRDVNDLSRALERAYEQRDMLEEMGRNGYEYIKDRFSWDKIGKQIFEIYQS